jgi:hypothetical protein
MWKSRLRRSFEVLKPAVIAGLLVTRAVVRQAINGCIACGQDMVQDLYLQKWHCGIYRDTSGRKKVVTLRRHSGIAAQVTMVLARSGIQRRRARSEEYNN